jgi:hypothetical protein
MAEEDIPLSIARLYFLGKKKKKKKKKGKFVSVMYRCSAIHALVAFLSRSNKRIKTAILNLNKNNK